jgi:heterodisulfide reductase subunit A-like polyferredoxin
VTEETLMKSKARFILCNCTGQCPGFGNLDFWRLLNYVRKELHPEYAVLHPQLCRDDGGRFLQEMLRPDGTYVIAACDPHMQKTMFRGAFEKTDVDFDEQVIPIDLRTLRTDQALFKLKSAFDEAGRHDAA